MSNPVIVLDQDKDMHYYESSIAKVKPRCLGLDIGTGTIIGDMARIRMPTPKAILFERKDFRFAS